MTAVVNNQSSDAHEANASHIPPSAFLLYINNLPANVLGTLVNINADDTTVYGCCTTRNQDNQCLAADLSAYLTLIAQ